MKRLECCIVGEHLLALECARTLYQMGHSIAAVCTSNDDFAGWAWDNDIPLLKPDNKPAAFPEWMHVDYVFDVTARQDCVAGFSGLSRSPRVRYWPAPTPFLHPRWALPHALLTGQREFGVCWYGDEGPAGAWVLKGKRFEITSADTSGSLLEKCDEAALETFSELLVDLARAQEERLLVARDTRPTLDASSFPPDVALLNFDRRADELCSLGRALSFGGHENPLGLPRVVARGGVSIVGDLNNTHVPSEHPPGTVTDVGGAGIRVATCDFDVSLKLSKAQNAAAPYLADRLSVGDSLCGLSAGTLAQAATLYRQALDEEGDWLRRLSQVSDDRPKFLFSINKGVRQPERNWESVPIELSDSANVGVSSLIAAVSGYLSRVLGTSGLTLAFSNHAWPEKDLGIDGLFSSSRPLKIYAPEGRTFRQLVSLVEQELAALNSGAGFIADVFDRHPEFKACADWQRRAAASVRVCAPGGDDAPGEAWHPDDLVITIVTGEGGRVASARMQFDAVRFSGEPFLHLSADIGRFLRVALEAPDSDLAGVPLLNDAEKHKILQEWNATRRPFPDDRSIQQLFEEQARRTPERVALVHGEQTITYGEMNRLSDKLAAVIRKRYLDKTGAALRGDELIGLCMNRSLELVVSVYGVWKAGAAYVPLDPSAPGNRLQSIIGDAGLKLVLAHSELLREHASLSELSAEFLCVDEACREPEHATEVRPDCVNSPTDLAYVIYTSGTTGEPKGVMIEHRSLVNRITWMQEQYRLSSTDRVLYKTPYTFDVSVWELTWPLIAGACLVVAEHEGHKDAGYLIRAIQKHRVTDVHFVPPMLGVFLQACAAATPTTLKRVYCSGEALSAKMSSDFYELLPDARLYNLYGPTETTIDVTHWRCRRSDGERFGSTPIGKPINNVTAYVLDGDMNPLPVGAPGQLYIGGVGVGRGYLNRPQLTGEKYVENPFVTGAERDAGYNLRLYKSGDVARWLPGGDLEYLGRVDSQVKVRGMRVELGEIESILCRQPGVSHAVVADWERHGEKVLVAYYVPAHPSVTAEGLALALSQHLPDYMLPAAWVTLRALRLSANGKVDRKTLPEPSWDSPASDAVGMASASENESAIAALWRELFRRDQVGLHDNFFALGGSSLLAGSLLLRLQEKLRVSLTMREFYDHPTVARLSAYVTENESRLRSEQQDIFIEEF